MVEKEYTGGHLSASERHNTIIDKWSRATDQIRETMFANMKRMSYEGDSINPIYVMSDSGGQRADARQLISVRGGSTRYSFHSLLFARALEALF